MTLMMVIVGVTMFSYCKKASVEQVTLKITKTGEGVVTADWPGGTATQEELIAGIKINKNVQVTLNAIPDESTSIVWWNEATKGTTYSVTMSQDQDIKVEFAIVTYTLTLPSDGSLIAYTDNQHTQPVTNLSRIIPNSPIYLKVATQNTTINTITGIDNGTLSSDKKTAIVTMTTDKSITASVDIDIADFVFIVNGSVYTITAYSGSNTDISIPATYNSRQVTTIGDGINPISIDLKSVIISNSVTSIASGAFANTTNLTNITIPNNVRSIGSSAFAGCSSLKSATILNGLTAIPANTFYSCVNLTNVNIGNAVTSIDPSAFTGCTKLTILNIATANPNFIIQSDGVIYDKEIKTIVLMPPSITNYTMPNSVTSFSFKNNTTLQTVSIGSGMRTIPSYAFSACTGLTNVTIPINVTIIENNAFAGCTGLTSIITPSNLTNMADEAFLGCSKLTVVTVQRSSTPLTTLGTNVFSGTASNLQIKVPRTTVDAYKLVSGWTPYVERIVFF